MILEIDFLPRIAIFLYIFFMVVQTAQTQCHIQRHIRHLQFQAVSMLNCQGIFFPHRNPLLKTIIKANKSTT